METFLEDIIEQICVSNILMESETISGRRLGLIVVDNSIEFMLKAYGDTRLVGKVIKKREWENKKENFKQMLSFVALQSMLSIDLDEILRFHDVRNALYHGALPLSVEPKKITDYLDIAIKLLANLFDVKFSKKEWDAKIEKTRTAFRARVAPKLVEFSRTEDGLVKILTTIELKDAQAILLAIYGFATIAGRVPNLEELRKSLSYSGYLIREDVLRAHITQLRKAKKPKIGKKELSLTREARKLLKKRYFIPLLRTSF